MGILNWLFGKRKETGTVLSEFQSVEEEQLQKIQQDTEKEYNLFTTLLRKEKMSLLTKRGYTLRQASDLHASLYRLAGLYLRASKVARAFNIDPMNAFANYAETVHQGFNSLAKDLGNGDVNTIKMIVEIMEGIISQAKTKIQRVGIRDDHGRLGPDIRNINQVYPILLSGHNKIREAIAA